MAAASSKSVILESRGVTDPEEEVPSVQPSSVDLLTATDSSEDMKTEDVLNQLVNNFALNNMDNAADVQSGAAVVMSPEQQLQLQQLSMVASAAAVASPQQQLVDNSMGASALAAAVQNQVANDYGASPPTTVIDYPEEDLVFQLIEDAKPPQLSNVEFQTPRTPPPLTNPVNPSAANQQLLFAKKSPLKVSTKEGEAIMAGLSGFGAANIGQHGPPAGGGGGGPSHMSMSPGPPSQPQQQSHQHHQQQQQHDKMPFVKIIEQPAENKLRFRYECEGRSAGALHGVNHSNENKTFPTIQVVGYKGPAVVVVSCVEDKPPHRTHPHNLVGKDGMCKKGVCSVDFNNPDMTVSFQNIGIQCVKRRDAPASLARREQIQVDPFKQGFRHKNASINLNCIRLCFQVFLKTDDGLFPLAPVVSNVIRDKKSHSDLQIVDYSDDSCPVQGGKKIVLLCEKVCKDDIEVHFTLYTKAGEPVTSKGDFGVNDVHKQYGISLKTPPYPNLNITSPVKVSMYLYKPSDRSTSEPVDFWYYPSLKDEGVGGGGGGGGAAEFANKATPVGRGLGGGGSVGGKASGNKRERERAANRGNDDPSSGMVNVPPKITPEQMRGSGGQVVVVNNQDMQQQQQQMFNPQGYSAVTGGNLFTDMVTTASVAAAHYSGGGGGGQQHMMGGHGGQGGQMHQHQMGGYEPPPPPPLQQHRPHPPPPQQQQQRPDQHDQKAINDFGNPPILNTSELIAGMSLTNIDVNTADLENLSSNLGTNLKLEREQNKQAAAAAAAGAKNNLSGGGGDQQQQQQRQQLDNSNNLDHINSRNNKSHQLDTPDVSCNLDDPSRTSKNNLNK